jgi:hypothetical protein
VSRECWPQDREVVRGVSRNDGHKTVCVGRACAGRKAVKQFVAYVNTQRFF